MNVQRRKEIGKIVDQLHPLKEQLDVVLSDEEESLENLPDSFRDGERGETMQEGIDSLENTISLLAESLELLCEIANVSLPGSKAQGDKGSVPDWNKSYLEALAKQKADERRRRKVDGAIKFLVRSGYEVPKKYEQTRKA